MESGFLQHIASTLFLPMYMWIVFGFLCKYAPKIFCRVGLGALFYFLVGLSLLAVDVIGHVQHQGNDTQCLYKYMPGPNPFQWLLHCFFS